VESPSGFDTQLAVPGCTRKKGGQLNRKVDSPHT
jgi:hypothetical protein